MQVRIEFRNYASKDSLFYFKIVQTHTLLSF